MVRAITFDQFGTDKLAVTERDPREPGPGQVLVRVGAVSLNYRDLMMVRGHYNPKLNMPLIPCSDGAGTVEAVGRGVVTFAPGDRVCSTMIPDWHSGMPGPNLLKTTLGGPVDGMLAEYRVLPEQALLPIPDYLSLEEAACLPVAGLTAWSSLMVEGRVKSYSKVLLLGTGGVSIMALAIAKAVGAEVAITSGSDLKLARAKELGADHLINYNENPKWAKSVLELFPEGADCVLEVGGAGTFDQSIKSTRVGGTVALIGVLAATDTPVNLTAVLMKRIRVQGILVGSRADFSDYLGFLDKHRLHPVIDTTFEGLDKAQAAFEHMAAGRHFGKIVISL